MPKQTLSASVIKIRLIITWKKIKSLGFTHAVVDIRPITGEVLYKSEYAPQMKEWKGAKAGDFDYLGYFIKKGTNWGWRYTPH
ncbi:hypothetical protein NXX56_22075 [Bacteroides thetaiotaomicron]|nr:hypothetical protein [Bacteroides thetaiotaomicron]